MPAEAIRLQRRLGTRDRWFIGLLVLAALVGSAAAVAIGRAGSSAANAAGCVSISRASWMGSATFRACGANAITFCRKSARRDEEIAAKCEEQGLPTS